jgi:hypothetical protein
MKSKLFLNKVYVKKSPMHGYGVFAGKTLKKGEKIEECYIILSKKGGDKGLEDYYFDAKGKYAVFTGYGSIYNHSDDENADYFISVTRRIATIKAARTIQKGEEIVVSYGEEWFSDRGVKAKTPRALKKAVKNKSKKTSKRALKKASSKKHRKATKKPTKKASRKTTRKTLRKTTRQTNRKASRKSTRKTSKKTRK